VRLRITSDLERWSVQFYNLLVIMADEIVKILLNHRGTDVTLEVDLEMANILLNGKLLER
jgi:hypothetical protein